MNIKHIALCVCLIGVGIGAIYAAEKETDITSFYEEIQLHNDLKIKIKNAPLKDTISKQNFDIAGIKIGSSIDIAKKLKSINSKYKIKEFDKSIPRSIGTSVNGEYGVRGEFTTSPGMYDGDVFTISEDDYGKVFYLIRGQSFQEKDYLSIQAFYDSIFEKYGRPSYVSGPTILVWFYDRNGEQIFRAANSSEKQFGGCGYMTKIDFVFYTPPTESTIFKKCGREIRVYPHIEPKTGLIMAFRIAMINHKDVYDKIEADRQKLIKETKGNRPSL
ncbi:MAG: hypothetical protein LBQ18_02950 [Campylobacteraceae bacterium]|jgi:hypothetical protein|nr:hypothetical protein [Campylobacteraceae bacterium]